MANLNPDVLNGSQTCPTVDDSYVNRNGASKQDICIDWGKVPPLPESETPEA